MLVDLLGAPELGQTWQMTEAMEAMVTVLPHSGTPLSFLERRKLALLDNHWLPSHRCSSGSISGTHLRESVRPLLDSPHRLRTVVITSGAMRKPLACSSANTARLDGVMPW